jgi:hypothetical protein
MTLGILDIGFQFFIQKKGPLSILPFLSKKAGSKTSCVSETCFFMSKIRKIKSVSKIF